MQRSRICYARDLRAYCENLHEHYRPRYSAQLESATSQQVHVGTVVKKRRMYDEYLGVQNYLVQNRRSYYILREQYLVLIVHSTWYCGRKLRATYFEYLVLKCCRAIRSRVARGSPTFSMYQPSQYFQVSNSAFHISMCISYMQTCNINLPCDFDTQHTKSCNCYLTFTIFPSQQKLLMQRNGQYFQVSNVRFPHKYVYFLHANLLY